MMNADRLLRRSIPSVAAALALLLPCSLDAQRKAEQAHDLVILEKVEPYKSQGKLFVVVRGRAPDVPPGTIIDFVLTWRSMTIDTFPHEQTDSRIIDTEFEIGHIPRTRERFYFRTIIESSDQSAAVLAKLKRRPALFEPALDPWTDHHFKHKFRLLTMQEEDASLGPIRAFFVERRQRLLDLDRRVDEQLELAVLGEEYVDSAGKFDPGAWRKFLDDSVLAEIHDVLRDVESAHKQTRYLPYRHALARLAELGYGVALQTFDRSQRLYRKMSLPVDPADAGATGFDLTKGERRKLTGLDFAMLVRSIDEELGLVPTNRVEDPFEMVHNEDYQGIVFRHLTADELARGKFDAVRARATWTPTHELISQLEVELRRYVRENTPEKTGIATGLENFQRQYVGVADKSGAELVHVTLVHLRSPRIVRLMEEVLEPDPTTQVYSVLYDPGQKVFVAPRF